MKRKLLKKFVKCLNIWLIPITKRNVFPCYHSCLEKKKKDWFWETDFFFFWVNEQRWFKFWTWNHSFPFHMEELSLSFYSTFICHPNYCFCPSIPFSLYCWSSDPMEKAVFNHLPYFFFLNIDFCLYGWRQDCSLFSWQAPSIHRPAIFV